MRTRGGFIKIYWKIKSSTVFGVQHPSKRGQRIVFENFLIQNWAKEEIKKDSMKIYTNKLAFGS